MFFEKKLKNFEKIENFEIFWMKGNGKRELSKDFNECKVGLTSVGEVEKILYRGYFVNKRHFV